MVGVFSEIGMGYCIFGTSLGPCTSTTLNLANSWSMCRCLTRELMAGNNQRSTVNTLHQLLMDSSALGRLSAKFLPDRHYFATGANPDLTGTQALDIYKKVFEQTTCTALFEPSLVYFHHISSSNLQIHLHLIMTAIPTSQF